MKKILSCFLLAFSFSAVAATGPYAEVTPGGSVVNLVIWDGASGKPGNPADTLVSATGQPNAQIGGTYANGVFTAPATPAPAPGIIFQNSPVAGATVALPNAPQPQATLIVYLQPAVSLATLTLTLPTSPQDNDQIIVISTKAVGAVTWGVQVGVLLVNTPASIVAGTPVYLRYSAQYNTWFKL